MNPRPLTEENPRQSVWEEHQSDDEGITMNKGTQDLFAAAGRQIFFSLHAFWMLVYDITFLTVVGGAQAYGLSWKPDYRGIIILSK